MTDTTDAIQPDQVAAPGTALERAPEQRPRTALEAAADAALAMPGPAGHDEFLTLCMKARMLSMSDLAPKALRGKPYDMLLVLMTGRSLGLDETTAMRKVYVIDGQTSLAPQLEVALIRRWRLGDVVPHPDNSKTWAAAIPLGRDGQPIGDPVAFDWEDAVDAELVDPTCGPDPERPERIRHNLRRLQKRGRNNSTYTVENACLCKDNYRHYGQDMLYWRAVGRCVRFYFSEVGLGLYSPDELGALTDDQGAPIDPTTVALPQGFTDPGAEQRERQEAAQAAASARAEAERLAEPDDLWALQELIHALPEGARADLAAKWQEEDSRLRGHKAWALPRRLLPTAKAMVNAHWGTARAAGVDRDTEVDALRQRLGVAVCHVFRAWYGQQEPATAAQAPQDGPEPESGPDTPADTSEPVSDDQGPDWAEELRLAAAAVQETAGEVPPEVATRIAGDVAALHWSAVNREVDAAGLADVAPPASPIDLRRMVVTLVRLKAFQETGAVPEGGDGDG